MIRLYLKEKSAFYLECIVWVTIDWDQTPEGLLTPLKEHSFKRVEKSCKPD